MNWSKKFSPKIILLLWRWIAINCCCRIKQNLWKLSIAEGMMDLGNKAQVTLTIFDIFNLHWHIVARSLTNVHVKWHWQLNKNIFFTSNKKKTFERHMVSVTVAVLLLFFRHSKCSSSVVQTSPGANRIRELFVSGTLIIHFFFAFMVGRLKWIVRMGLKVILCLHEWNGWHFFPLLPKNALFSGLFS